jgi:3-(3-hydroxy-phenyl)propionate hydroxylase
MGATGNEAPRDGLWDVAVVGYGPSGAVAAALLAQQGLSVWVGDKSTTIYDKPRAFALDHEILRVFQQLGLHERILSHAEPFTPSEFYGTQGQLIKRFTSADPPWPMAFAPSWVFNQPAAEQVLRDHVTAQPRVRVALGTEVTGLSQDDDRVTLQTLDADGTTGSVRARHVIGCDGASSRVRQWLGIELDDLGFDQPWLVVDVRVNEAGAARLPSVSIQYCEPERPTTFLIGPGNHRRWEISINPGEDPAALTTPEGTWRLLSRWIGPEHGELWRQASYRFHALVARQWRVGRCFIAGDAAHQQPPFLGQGMCQGIRDVSNLAWKLAAVHRGAPDALLDTYGEERAEHVRQLTTRIKGIGQLIGERDLAAARARDEHLLAECGGVVRSVPRADVQPALCRGLLHEAGPAQRPGVGALFPQPWIVTAEGRARMDDVLGRGWRVVSAPGASEAIREIAESLAQDLGGARHLPLGTPGFEEADGVAAAWLARHDARVAIVRPDHYVWGVARTAEQLMTCARSLQDQLAAQTATP